MRSFSLRRFIRGLSVGALIWIAEDQTWSFILGLRGLALWRVIASWLTWFSWLPLFVAVLLRSLRTENRELRTKNCPKNLSHLRRPIDHHIRRRCFQRVRREAISDAAGPRPRIAAGCYVHSRVANQQRFL